MSINTQTKIMGDTLLVNAHGFFTKDGLLEAAEKSLNIAIRENLKKILFDASELEGKPPTTMERLEMSEAFSKMQRDKGIIKTAFVGKEPIVDPERFGETVAVNRGGLIAVFTDISEAKKWLESMR